MTRLTVVLGDITTLEVDVIVNAANSSLMGGGGVDGAIHRAGGPAILDECKTIVTRRGPLPTGEAVITTAGLLPASHVIHTVGPIWGTVPDDQAISLLSACYRNSLGLARKAGARTIAFPSISTGAYRFPKDLAARTAVSAVRDWLDVSPETIDEVVYACFSADDVDRYLSILED